MTPAPLSPSFRASQSCILQKEVCDVLRKSVLVVVLVSVSFGLGNASGDANEQALVDEVEVSNVLEASRFGKDVTLKAQKALKVSTSLGALISNSGVYEPVGSSIALTATVPEDTDAKEVAEAVWYVLSGDNRFRGVDCGYFLMGETKIDGTQVGNQPSWSEYTITYSDDGFVDTCSGEGAPGYAVYEIAVSLGADNGAHLTLLSTVE